MAETRFFPAMFFSCFICIGLTLQASCGENSPAVDIVHPRWEVVEYELTYSGPVDNPFVEVEAVGQYTGPAGKSVRVEGFYDGGEVWKFRFVPRMHGSWKVELSLKHEGREVAAYRETFLCSGDHGHGFLKVSVENPYRLAWEDGTPFYPIGIQPCGQDHAGLDGPPRGEGKWRTVDMDTYLQAFQGAANLFRIQLGVGTRAGCAREIIKGTEDLYRYELDALQLLDEVYLMLRKYGFATILIPFQDMSLWGVDSTSFGSTHDTDGWKNINNKEAVKPVKQYLRYLVARYSAYTDIWEFFNEDVYTPSEWLREIAAFVKELDPYDHLMTTNYERPLEPWCDLVTPHEYMWMPAREVDAHLSKEFARLKSFGKPVVYTEFGNQGELSNCDPVKWRIAVWNAFMNESAILFWSMGGIITPEREGPVRGNANAYLGREARQYFRSLQQFVGDLPLNLRPVMVGYGEKKDEITRYALSNGEITILYLHHYRDHDSNTRGNVYVWTGPGEFEIEWVDPATGEIVETGQASTDGHVLIIESPEFTVDLAATVRLKDN